MTGPAAKSLAFAAAILLLSACSLFPETPPRVDAGASGGSGGSAGSGGTGGGIAGSAGAGGTSGSGGSSCTTPDVVELSATADTYLLSPQTGSTHGAELVLELSPNGTRRALVRFELPGNLDPQTVVQSASLELTVEANQSFEETIVAHRVTEAWDEATASWNIALDAEAWSQPGGAFDPVGSAAATVTTATVSGSTVSFDLTADVASSIAGSQVMNGWLLKVSDPQGSTNDRLVFASREVTAVADRPRLTLKLCQ